MTENNAQAGAEQPAGTNAQLNIQKIFVNDISFEAPNSPEVFREQAQLDVQLNMSQKAKPVGDDTFEVLLAVTVTAKMGEKTAYLAEIQQGGIFGISGLDQPQLHAALGTYCPSVLFPYARQLIADLVGHGGFPPLVLQHINFDAMYADQMRQSQQAAAENGGSAE